MTADSLAAPVDGPDRGARRTRSSSTRMVMMMAMTASLKASTRVLSVSLTLGVLS